MPEEQKEIKVLHVDDESDFLALTKAFLERENENFSVDTATSAEEATELLKSGKYDVVVLDYQMPVMDGLEFLKNLRESGNTIPFIMFTGKGREEVAIDALNRGANGYLQKGTDIESMYGTLAHVIKQEVETKRANDELVEIKKEQQIVLESVPAMIFHVDSDSNYIYANWRFADTFGLKPEDFKGKSTKAIFPEEAETYIKSDKEVVKSGVPKIRIINELITPKGKRWLRTDKVPVKDADGNVTGVIGFGLDITARKKAEDELRNANKQLRDTIEFLPDATFVIDLDKKVIAWNRAIEEMTGVRKEDIIGKGDYAYAVPFYGIGRPILIDLIFLSDKEIETRYDYVKREGNTLFAEVFISSMYGGKGAYLWGTATPLLDSEGNIVGAIESIRDITEWKEAEGRIERLNIVLRAIRNVNQLITKEKDRDRLIKGVCDILVETRGYHNAWIALLDDAGRAVRIAEAGFGEDFLPMRERLKRSELPKCGRKALRQSDVVVTEDTATTCVDCPLSKDCRGKGAMTIRLKYGKKVYGLLSVSLPTEFTPEAEEQSSFGEMAGDIAFALHNMELEEERKRIEEALQESEKRLQTVVSNAPIVMWSLDKEGIFTLSEGKGLKALGLRPGEVVGQSVFDVYRDVPQIIEGNRRALAGESSVSIVEAGELIFESHYSPIRNKNGEVIGMIGVSIDITERKRAEEALRVSALQWQTSFDALSDSICLLDLEGRFLRCNKATAELLGKPINEIIGRTCWELVHGTSEPIEGCPIVRMRETRRRESLVLPVGDRWLDVSADPVLDENGKLIGAVHIISDITDRKRADETLRIAKEEYYDLYEKAPLGYHIVDSQGLITGMNKTELHWLGYTKAELIGKKTIFDIQTQESANRGRKLLQRLVKKGGVADIELDFVRKDGSVMPVNLNISVLHNSKGEFIRTRSIAIDITERKQAEETLRVFSRCADTSVDGIAVGNLEFRITYVNDAFAKMFGYSREELIGKEIAFIYSEDQIPKLEEALKATLEGSWTGELVGKRKDGALFPVAISASRAVDDKGNVIAHMTSQRDITEQKRADEKYRSLVESTEDSIYLVDRDCRYLFVNEKHLSRLGLPVDKIIGKTYGELHSEDETEEFAGIVERVFKTGKSVPHEHRSHRDSRYILRTLSPVKDSEGGVTAVTVVSKDISERKQAEERQLQMLKELETANNELKDFAHIVSHDLKAPLRAITALAEWLSTDYREKLDEAGREQMDLLINRVGRMHNLIEGILQYSRVGRLKEEEEAVDLNTLVSEVIDMIEPPENIDVEVVVNELPTILCEKTRMEQVFQNLLSNAVKYIDELKGKITVGCTEEDGYWKFSVADNGPGIEERYYGDIFQIFQTLKSRDEIESTGIGLAIVKKIVETHGGKIWLDSKVGRGTTFFFTIPKERERKEIKRKEEGGSIS